MRKKMSSILTKTGVCINALIQFFFILINRLITWIGSKELEKDSHEYKESSSTQTSSSSSLLHKRKVHSYYAVTNRSFKPVGSCMSAFWRRPERNQSATPQRIISAKFLKVKQLQNELSEAQQKITDLLEENRTLKNIHKRQDSALKKYDSQDSYLPQLIRSHEEELRVINSKYKKLKSMHLDLEARYNKQHSELVAVKERHRHLLQISKDKNLFQREHLTKQIEQMKTQINELKNKIQLQSRRLDLETKNYKHQLSVEISKQRNLQDQLKHLQETITQLQDALKDREKLIVNSKVNHLIPNKTVNYVKPKLPLNPLKPLRNCAVFEDDKYKQLITKDDRKENEDDSSDLINFVVGESLHPPNEQTTKNETANCSHQPNKSLIVCSNERPLDDSFHDHNSTTLSQKNTATKSDSNNNIKQNSLDSNLSDSQTKATYDEEQIRNCSGNSFEIYERSIHDETGSEKSDELKSPDDTISWLEFHERIERANDDIDLKLDEFCDSFGSRKLNQPKRWQNKFEVQVVNKTSRNNQHRGELSEDKKSALLTALSQIDEEKTDSNPFHAIFENAKNTSSSIRLNNVPKT